MIVTRGQKVLDLAVTATSPSDDELRGLVIGQSGKLRAPSMRLGDTLVVGFSADSYRGLLGKR